MGAQNDVILLIIIIGYFEFYITLCGWECSYLTATYAYNSKMAN